MIEREPIDRWINVIKESPEYKSLPSYIRSQVYISKDARGSDIEWFRDELSNWLFVKNFINHGIINYEDL
jgi:hypothetical protein